MNGPDDLMDGGGNYVGGNLRAAMLAADADGLTGDKVSRGMAIARDMDLSPSVALADYEDASREYEARRIEASPGFAAWAGQSEANAAVAMQHLDPMLELFQEMERSGKGRGLEQARGGKKEKEHWLIAEEASIWEQPGILLREGLEQVGDSFGKFISGTARFLSTGKITDAEGVERQYESKLLKDFADDLDRKLEEKRESRPARLESKSKFGGYVQDVIRMAPQLAYQIGAHMAGGPLASMAFMGAQIGGATYDKLTREGVDQDRAYLAGLGNSFVQSAMEAFAIGRFLEVFKARGLANIAKRTGQGMATEFFTEWMQQYSESGFEEWGKLKENEGAREWFERFIEALPETTKQGLYEGAVAAPFGLIGGLTRAAADAEARRDVDNFIRRNRSTHDRVEELRNAGVDQRLIESALAAGGMNVDVGVAASALMELNQNGRGVIESLGLDFDEVAQAAEAGQDVDIALGRLHAGLGKEAFEEVLPHVRMDEAAQTFDERRHGENMALDALRVAELYQDNINLFSDLDAEKERLRNEMTAEIDRTPGLRTQAEAAGGVDAYVDNILSILERGALRLGMRGNPVTILRKVTLDQLYAARRAAMSQEELVAEDLAGFENQEREEAVDGAAEGMPENWMETEWEVGREVPPGHRVGGARTSIILDGGAGKDGASYEVWELEDLVPSHDPENGFQRRSDYPAPAQERPYHSDRGEQDKVRGNALNYQPDLVINTNPTAENGPPLITDRGIVLGGNSRVMTLGLVYANNTAEGYRKMLAENAAQFGIDAERVPGMSRPVLVRVLDGKFTPQKMAVKSRQYNRSMQQRIQRKAEGVSRARMVSERSLAMMAAALEADTEMTLRSFLDTDASRKLIDSLMADGVLEQAEISSITDADGRLNESGKDLIETVFRGLAVPDYDILAALPASVLKKLDRCIPALARLKATGGQWNITNTLMAALRLTGKAARQNRTISAYLVQDDLVETDPDKKKPAVRALALVLGEATQKEAQARFEAFMEAGRKKDDSGFLTGTGAPDAVSAFINSFMKPVAVAGGNAIGNFDPEGSAYHAAIQWAHDNGGKGRNLDVAMRRLEKEIQEEKDGARKAELRGYMAALAHMEGSVDIYAARPERWYNYNGNSLFQLAWHGSPHRFKKFSLRRIGTGEGAQVHGWGLYFAADREVATEYRTRLGGTEYTYKGRRLLDIYNELEEKGEYDKLSVLEDFMTTHDIAQMDFSQFDPAAADWFRNKIHPHLKGEGRLYEVDVPDTQMLLDEQKALSEQSDYIKEALRKAEDSMPDDEAWANMAEYLNDAIQDGENITGKDLYRTLAALGTKDYERRQEISSKGAKAASQFLDHFGIKGISYEGREDGRCFVIFDEKAVNIVEMLYQDDKEGDPVEIDGNRLGVPEGADIKEYKKAARDIYRKFQKEPVKHKELGEIRFTGSGFGKLSYTGVDPRKWMLIPYLPEIISKGKVVETNELYKARKDNIKKFYWLENYVKLNDKILHVGIQIAEDNDGNKFYNLNQDLKGWKEKYGAFDLDPAESKAGNQKLHQDAKASGGKNVNTADDNVNLQILYSENDGKRGSTTIYPQTYLINLFKGADMSTLLHEIGHVFFEEMGALVASGAADANLVNDYRLLLDWLGAKPGEALTIEQREKAARGFEAYLMEGNAPARELEGAFGRFKRWLLNIYKSAAGLNVELTDEARGVFDRLLATESEMAWAASRNELLELTVQEMEALRMTEEERGALRDFSQKSLEDAADALQKARDENRRTRLRGYLERARALVGEMRVYAARAQMRKTPLDIEWIRNNFGDKVLSDRRKKLAGCMKKDGADPEIFAAQNGYENADKMIIEILDSPGKREAVKRKAAELEAEHDAKFGALEKLLEMDGPGVHMEICGRKLAELIGAQPIDRAAYVTAAYAAVDNMAMGKAIQSGRFMAAMRRELLKFRKNLLSGNLEGALEANRRALLNYEYARRSRELRENSEKLARAAQRMALNTKADADARFIVNNIAYRHRLTGLSEQLARGRDDTQNATIQNWLAQAKADGFDLFLDDSIVFGEGKSWKEMTVVEFENLEDTLRQIITVEINRREFISSKEKARLSEVISNIRDAIFANRKKKVLRTVERQPAAVRALEKIHAMHTKIECLCIALDGDRHGPCWENIIRPIARAEVDQAVRAKDAVAALKKLFSVYSRKELAEMGTRKELVPEVGERLTWENRIALALNMGNKDNVNRILRGHNWTMGQVLAILRPLTEKDWKFVQSVWDYLETFREESFDLQQKVTGIRPRQVVAKPFNRMTADGKAVIMRGGYYPIAYNPEFGQKAFEQSQKQMDNELFVGRNYGSAQTRQGHLQDRKIGLGTPLRLELDVLTDHVFNVIHDLSFRIPVLNVAKIIQNGQFREAMETTVGIEMYRQLKPWLCDIANERQEPMSQMHKMARWARASSTIMQMGFKVTTLVMQPMGITQTIELLGYKWTWDGLKTVYGNIRRLPDLYRETCSRSTFMANRIQSFDRDINDINKRIKPGMSRLRVIEFLKEKAFVPMGIVQMGVDMPTWWGAYSKGLHEHGGDEIRAAEYADSIVRMSQAAGNVKDLSAVQRGSEYQRLFTMFYSYFNTLYNLAARRFGQTNFRSGAGWLNAAHSALLLWFVPNILSEMVAGRGPDEPDDWKWYARTLLQYPFQAVVGIRDIATGVFGLYDYQLSPAQSAPASLVLWAKSVEQAIEKEDPGKLAKPTAEAVGYLLGLPLKQAIITLGNIWEYITGKDPDFEVRDLFFTKKKQNRK